MKGLHTHDDRWQMGTGEEDGNWRGGDGVGRRMLTVVSVLQEGLSGASGDFLLVVPELGQKGFCVTGCSLGHGVCGDAVDAVQFAAKNLWGILWSRDDK